MRRHNGHGWVGIDSMVEGVKIYQPIYQKLHMQKAMNSGFTNIILNKYLQKLL